MAQKYLNTSQAAEKLGLAETDISRMRENRELYGYRDGADWKFKVEDIEKVAAKAKPAKAADSDENEDDGDVLLSEVELGPSDAGASGTVIGMGKQGSASDGSDLHKPGKGSGKGSGKGDAVSQFEELDLTLDEDLTLEDSAISAKAGGSGIDLDDDDLVLGGSGSGSDITLGGDSGISLVDPADSGLSLEEPLDLGAGDESLELGEDDMIVLDDEDAATEMKGDDDFLLTPLDDEGDEDSESGSQVIALDTEGDESATMVASTSNASMAAMLDEDLGGGGLGLDDAAMGLPLGGQPGGMAAGAALMQPAAALPEAPWSVWAVVVLALCVVVLVFCGMFSYDLMRNMWSWEAAYDVNSNLMDSILSMFES
ncbi:MAG: helix-turn-helix domain-containing protein [Patescibacteria group bacterium]|nr:helix-turn-helix domain-containing protein [Patescibacteria group bacterium]